jgi:RNA polymerase sigma-70 factor (ECF subfamily)
MGARIIQAGLPEEERPAAAPGADRAVTRHPAPAVPAMGGSFAAAEEARLVTRILAGEGRLYGELVTRYQRRLYWSCLRLLADPDEAEDAVQEAFVRAYAHLREFDSSQRFYTWIFSIARNLCLNRLRSRRLWRLMSFSRHEAPAEPRAAEQADAQAEARELAEALSGCLQALPRDQRECFELRHAEEFSYQEIADVLGVPIGTVMSRLSRARVRMRACLEARGLGFR